jgi:hypothetical protein
VHKNGVYYALERVLQFEKLELRKEKGLFEVIRFRGQRRHNPEKSQTSEDLEKLED